MIIVVCGPTAVGKTKMSVELAKIYNGDSAAPPRLSCRWQFP